MYKVYQVSSPAWDDFTPSAKKKIIITENAYIRRMVVCSRK